MARPSNWKTPTTAIRIPAHLAELLVAYAQSLETTDIPNLFDDGYKIGQMVYHKQWRKHPAVGHGIIEHLTPHTIYVLWMGNNPEQPKSNWKEIAPSAYGRQFSTNYIIPSQEYLQLSIA